MSGERKLRPKQLADILGVSIQSVYRYCKDGMPHSVSKSGRQIWCAEEDYWKWVRQTTVAKHENK